MKIFLSYSTKDEQIVKNVTKLMPFGVDPWIDHKKISGGSFLSNKIKQGIKEADIFFIFISQDAINSKWVLDELNWALEKEKKLKYDYIVPIVLEQTTWEGWKKNPIKDKKYSSYNTNESLYVLANEMKNSIVDKTIEKFKYQCLLKKDIFSNFGFAFLYIILGIAFFTEPTEKEHIQNLLSKSTSCNTSQIQYTDMWFFSYSTCPIGSDKKLFSFGVFDIIFVRENQNR